MAGLRLTILPLVIVLLCSEWHQTEASRCQDGWIQYEQSCYLFVTTSATWFRQEQHCVELGGHLATINDKAEETFLESEMKRRYASFWIGGTNKNNNRWVWIENNSPISMKPCGRSEHFCAWNAQEPNNFHGHEHCLEMNFSLLWNDNECSLSQGAICEAAPLPERHWVAFGNSSA